MRFLAGLQVEAVLRVGSAARTAGRAGSSGFAHHFERSSACVLVFDRNSGDTWAFTVLGDRLPIAAMMVVGYFGVFRASPALGTAYGLLAILFIWSAPNRWGIAIALHYLSRVLGRDRDDPISPDRESRRR